MHNMYWAPCQVPGVITYPEISVLPHGALHLGIDSIAIRVARQTASCGGPLETDLTLGGNSDGCTLSKQISQTFQMSGGEAIFGVAKLYIKALKDINEMSFWEIQRAENELW